MEAKERFPPIRKLNLRKSALRTLLVSLDLTSDDISATGGRLRFVPLSEKAIKEIFRKYFG